MAGKRRTFDIKSLFYITHVDNVPSMLAHGILSHAEMERRGVKTTAIYDAEIVSNRKLKQTPAGKSLWEYANVYFNARNPMLYRVTCNVDLKSIAVLSVKPAVIDTPGAFLTDGNAANGPTEFYEKAKGLEVLEKNWGIVQSDWWNNTDGSKRKIMAECLVPTLITPDMIQAVYVPGHEAQDRLKTAIGGGAHIIPEPNLFFRPIATHRLTDKLALVDGDMFFSRAQTLTISVNVVGVMGKGLASRAKYQFPDVYVAYQDVCRNKKLKMGKPYLYKRESSLDIELADEPLALEHSNAMRWFLLFATKSHWRQDSDLAGIEQGMKWLAENHKTLGIKSIAMPALGCGLGNLPWRDVGPIMCRSLASMDGLEFSRIYLPREHPIADEELSRAYLLGA
jgi:O-acetyl-ADP-ribose deacetylase (regulator of RNase III)